MKYQQIELAENPEGKVRTEQFPRADAEVADPAPDLVLVLRRRLASTPALRIDSVDRAPRRHPSSLSSDDSERDLPARRHREIVRPRRRRGHRGGRRRLLRQGVGRGALLSVLACVDTVVLLLQVDIFRQPEPNSRRNDRL